MVDTPVRFVSIFYGEDDRTATVWQDLKSRKYTVECKVAGKERTLIERDNASDAEDSAEDWVLQQ
jgi:hypothetical protein